MCLAQGPQRSNAGEARTLGLQSSTLPLRSPTYEVKSPEDRQYWNVPPQMINLEYKIAIGLDKRKILNIKLGIFSNPSVWTYDLGAQKNRLIETVLLSTHNICFGWEIRKLIFWYDLLKAWNSWAIPHLKIEIQIISLHWNMLNIRLFNVCEALSDTLKSYCFASSNAS